MNQTTLKEKQTLVKEITELAKKSGSMLIVSFAEMTVAELSELRKTLRGMKATFGVYKNTLVRRAAEQLGYQGLNDALNGPNAFVFSPDALEGPKAVVKFAKRNEKLIVKGGIIDGKFVDGAMVKVLANLPAKPQLISMFLSVLNGPIRKFAVAVKAVSEKVEKQA
jgi:large subunit ribosomal protein L10